MSPWFAMVLDPALPPCVLIGAGAATVVAAKMSSWQSFVAPFGYCVLLVLPGHGALRRGPAGPEDPF